MKMTSGVGGALEVIDVAGGVRYRHLRCCSLPDSSWAGQGFGKEAPSTLPSSQQGP